MELVSEAIAFAVKAHDGMRRKKSEAPYILHPMEAAVIVGTMTDDQAMIAAAALHDVVEDAGITIEEISDSIGCCYARSAELTGLLEIDGIIIRDLLQRCSINPKFM